MKLFLFISLFIFLIAFYLVLLWFPVVGMTLNALLALIVLWPLAIAYREHKKEFYRRRPHARLFPSLSSLSWFGNVVITLELSLLGLLFYLLSCRCSRDPMAVILIPCLTLFVFLILYFAGQRSNTQIKLQEYAFVRLSLLMGLVFSFILQLSPLLNGERGFFGKAWGTVINIFAFLKGVGERDVCQAYLGLDGSLDGLISTIFPQPFSMFMKVVIQSEVAFGLLIVLYAIALIKFLRVDDGRPLVSDNDPPEISETSKKNEATSSRRKRNFLPHLRL